MGRVMKKMKKLVVLLMAVMLFAVPVKVEAKHYYEPSCPISTYFDSSIQVGGWSEDWSGSFYYSGPVNANLKFRLSNWGSTRMYYMVFAPDGTRIAYSSVRESTIMDGWITATTNGTYRLYLFDEAEDGNLGYCDLHIYYEWR